MLNQIDTLTRTQLRTLLTIYRFDGQVVIGPQTIAHAARVNAKSVETLIDKGLVRTVPSGARLLVTEAGRIVIKADLQRRNQR